MSELLSALGGTAIGVAVGEATGTVLEPSLEAPKQEALKDAADAGATKVLELRDLAELVAQALNSVQDVLDSAKRNGYDEDALRSSIQLALKAPGVGEALTLARRAKFDGVTVASRMALLEHALAKGSIEGQYWSALKGLVTLPLESAQLAQGIHRGYIAYSAPGFVAPPDTPGNVPFYPQTSIDALATAAANGEDAEQLQVLVGIAGLPLSLFEMLQLLNRGLVTEDDVKRAIANSNLQNQYMDVALDLKRRLLTPSDYSELRLRGWITDQQGRDGAALSGMESDDADLLYHMHGRPLIPHQIITASERGGVYDDPMKTDAPGTIRAELVAQLQAEGYSLTLAHALVDSAQESNIQPQYYGMYIANRYAIPPLFQTVSLLKSGSISPDLASQWLLKGGYDPEDVKTIVTSVGGTGGTAQSSHVRSATTSAITATRKAFLSRAATEASARDTLTQLGIGAAEQDQLVAVWTAEQNIGGPIAQPPPVPPDSDIDALIAAGWTVYAPATQPNAVSEALVANGYSVSPPAPKQILPGTGLEPGT